jgi:hypothetical protein
MEQNNECSIQDFAERFDALAGEAASYGMTVIYALASTDPLMEIEDHEAGYVGSYSSALGLIQILRDSVTRDD